MVASSLAVPALLTLSLYYMTRDGRFKLEAKRTLAFLSHIEDLHVAGHCVGGILLHGRGGGYMYDVAAREGIAPKCCTAAIQSVADVRIIAER